MQQARNFIKLPNSIFKTDSVPWVARSSSLKVIDAELVQKIVFKFSLA